MLNLSEKTVFFVGHRAGQLLSTLKELDMCATNFNSIHYHNTDPLSDIHGSVYVNGQEAICNVEYDVSELKAQFVDFLTSDFSSDKFLLIGDPSELIYQSLTLSIHTKANLNPNFNSAEDFCHAWFYPMGMITSDVRKEISALVYELKKNGSNVFVTRKTDAELVGFLPKVIEAFEGNKLQAFVSRTEELEQIVGKTKEKLQLG